MKLNPTVEISNGRLLISVDVAALEADILAHYGLSPIGKRAAKVTAPKAKVGRRARRRRRSSAEVAAVRKEKTLIAKAKKQLKLNLRGRISVADQQKLVAKVAELKTK